MSATATATSTFTTTTTLVGSPDMKGVTLSQKQCPMCWGEGLQSESGAHDRIQELEGQVHALTARASVTAVKLNEYEEEVRRLRSSQSQVTYDTPRSSLGGPPPSSQDQSQAPIERPTSSESQPQPQTYHSRLTTLASLIPYRRSSTTPASAPSTSNGPPPLPATPTNPLLRMHSSPASSDNAELQDALEREQGLRKAAETQLSQASSELEELTVQLFSQANEMVAQERKARAKLEERVAVLERRDAEKRGRLERLEKAIARIERLKALVNQ